MKIINIDSENLHILWAAWEISIKYLGKIWLMIIWKSTKKTVLYPLSRRYTFGKATGERGQIDHPFPHSSIFLSVKIYLGNLQDVSERVLAFLNRTSWRHVVDVLLPNRKKVQNCCLWSKFCFYFGWERVISIVIVVLPSLSGS